MSAGNLTRAERDFCQRAGVDLSRFEAMKGVRTLDEYKTAVRRLKASEDAEAEAERQRAVEAAKRRQDEEAA